MLNAQLLSNCGVPSTCLRVFGKLQPQSGLVPSLFYVKVPGVRASTSDAPLPLFKAALWAVFSVCSVRCLSSMSWPLLVLCLTNSLCRSCCQTSYGRQCQRPCTFPRRTVQSITRDYSTTCRQSCCQGYRVPSEFTIRRRQ